MNGIVVEEYVSKAGAFAQRGQVGHIIITQVQNL